MRRSVRRVNRNSGSLGCCAIGLVIAVITGLVTGIVRLFGALFQALGAIIRPLSHALWRAMPQISTLFYYLYAWPLLIFEHIWNIGGPWRRVAQGILALTVVVSLIILVQRANAPTPVAIPPTATATATTAPRTPSVTTAASPTNTPSIPTVTTTEVPATATVALQPATQIPATNPRIPVGAIAAQVVRIVDGDTVRVILDDQEIVTRLIGINTPETKAPNTSVECFGPEASDFATATLSGQTVYLEYDPSQDRLDRYDRHLVYVWLSDGRNFNELMITEGYAFEYTYDNPYKYVDAFRAAEADARTNQRGLWSPSTCAGGTSAPVAPVTATSAPAPDAVTPLPAGVLAAQVARVVDGDTVRVILDGQEIVTRLIGIDTPETKAPNKPVECFGPEASDFATQTLRGQTVYLEYDPSQDRLDRYDRHLVYLWLSDGRNFNELMIANGFAFEYTYNKPYLYVDTFRAAQTEARTNQRGLWSPTTCNGQVTP